MRNFENPPQRDGTGRITGMQRQHPFVDVSIVYEAGETLVHEIQETPKGLSIVPAMKDFAGAQHVHVVAEISGHRMVHTTLEDPNLFLVPQDSDEPKRAITTDRRGKVVIFEASGAKIRSTTLPQNVQE
ncbi:MAG: hypothetical protein HYT10_00720 [Candidatus Levybacteria bacterium]|nr:hypothetical protein [Candidatus Levybacteria bacterium]